MNYMDSMQTITDFFGSVIDCERITIWAKTLDGRYLYPVIMQNVKESVKQKMVIDLSVPNGGLAFCTAIYGDWLVLNKNDAEIKANSVFERITGYQVTRSIAIPILGADNKTIIGVLQGLNTKEKIAIYDVFMGTCLARSLSKELQTYIEETQEHKNIFYKNRAEKISEAWAGDWSNSGILELDKFVLSSAGIMSMLWNLSKSLELLDDYEDSIVARHEYFCMVFEHKAKNIIEHLGTLKNKILELRQIANYSETINIFIHQINPVISLVETTIRLLKTCFEREHAETHTYDKAKFMSMIHNIVKSLNMFYRLTKQYILLDDEIKDENISASELNLWAQSYETWFANYRYAGIESNIVLSLDISINQDITYHIDLAKIKECIDAIFTNAAEELILGNIENPKILFSILGDENTLSFSIGDNGRGIPEEIKHKVFDRYFTSNKPTGTGIGLGMSKAIIDNMGGKITVANEDGAVFRIQIPTMNFHV
ncbi:MAG: HAMP domain-containing sensor histidine kinase [Campylobacterales bacterium]|nr:HAMP domain-containing sensor histidine kinase [Campylobacterales bacterium]